MGLRLRRGLMRRLGRMLYQLLGRVEIRGLENIPRGMPYLAAINHTSIFDAPLVLGFWPESIAAIGAAIAASPVAWDLSNLQDVTLADDTNRTQGELLPEKITVQELDAHTKDGYLLKSIPAGFDLEITAPPRQDHETSYVYIASYRTEAGDYFVIQAGGAPEVLMNDAAEVYTTVSGLVVSFMREPEQSPDGKHYQSAAVKAPDGTTFFITSTLPRERVKALAEDLVIVQ